MEKFHLEDGWATPEKERAFISAVAKQPELYLEFVDDIRDDIFTDPVATEAWENVAKRIEAGGIPESIEEWEPADNPRSLLQELSDARNRRHFAGFVERFAKDLHAGQPVDELMTLLEDEVARTQAQIQEVNSRNMTWAVDLFPSVLLEAEARRRQYQETGKAAMGLPTGIKGLDSILNGLNQGIYLLAGPPGVGKTTFAVQVAKNVAPEVPVVFVTFENSPCNLTLKALTANIGHTPQDVHRGFVEMKKLVMAAKEWQPVAERLALIEGHSKLKVSQVQAQARRALHKFKADRCLLIVDYLQLWAKAAAELRSMGTIRERVETLGACLKELASQLRSPVLAIASQNRERGHYGGGSGGIGLDSLKESGDLEYMADAVLFLCPKEANGPISAEKSIHLVIAKNRHGGTGMVKLIFRPDLGTFREEDPCEKVIEALHKRNRRISKSG